MSAAGGETKELVGGEPTHTVTGTFSRRGPKQPRSDPVSPDPVSPDPVSPDPVSPDPVSPNPVSPNPVSSGPFDRFLLAQNNSQNGYEAAERQLGLGKTSNTSQWIGYIFPQLTVLYKDEVAKEYGINDLKQACDYLRNETLFDRYSTLVEIIREKLVKGQSLARLLGSEKSAEKFISSITLFELALKELLADLTVSAENKRKYEGLLGYIRAIFDRKNRFGNYSRVRCEQTLSARKIEMDEQLRASQLQKLNELAKNIDKIISQLAQARSDKIQPLYKELSRQLTEFSKKLQESENLTTEEMRRPLEKFFFGLEQYISVSLALAKAAREKPVTNKKQQLKRLRNHIATIEKIKRMIGGNHPLAHILLSDAKSELSKLKASIARIKRIKPEEYDENSILALQEKIRVLQEKMSSIDPETDPDAEETTAKELRAANKALEKAKTQPKGKEEEKEEEIDFTSNLQNLNDMFAEFHKDIRIYMQLNNEIYFQGSPSSKKTLEQLKTAYLKAKKDLKEIYAIVRNIDGKGKKDAYLCDIAVAAYCMAVERSVFRLIPIIIRLRELATQPASSSSSLQDATLKIQNIRRWIEDCKKDTEEQLRNQGLNRPYDAEQIRVASARFVEFLKFTEIELEAIRNRDPVSSHAFSSSSVPAVLEAAGFFDYDNDPNPSEPLEKEEKEKEEYEEDEEDEEYEEYEEDKENADENQSFIPKQQPPTTSGLFVQFFSRLGILKALLDEANSVIKDTKDDEKSIANAKRVAIAVDEALSKLDDSTEEKKLLKGKLLIEKYNLLIKEQNRAAKHLVKKIELCAANLDKNLAEFIEVAAKVKELKENPLDNDSYRKKLRAVENELNSIAAAAWRYQQQIKNFKADAEKLNDKIEEDKKNILAALKGFKDLENPQLEVNILYREKLAAATTTILLDIQSDEKSEGLLKRWQELFSKHPTPFSPRLRALKTWSELERRKWACMTVRRLLDYTPAQIANDDNLFARYQEAILILDSDPGDIEDRSATAIVNNIIKASDLFLLAEEKPTNKLARWSQNGSFYGSQRSDATSREIWQRAELRAEQQVKVAEKFFLTVVAVEELTGVVSFYVVFLNPQQKWTRAPLLTFIKTRLKRINTSDEAAALNSIQQALSSAEEDPRYALSYQYGGIAQEVAIELEKAAHLFSRQGLKYRASVSKFVDSVKASSESIRKQRERENDSMSENLSLIRKALSVKTVRRALLAHVYAKDTLRENRKAAEAVLEAQQKDKPVDIEMAARLDSLSFMPGRNEWDGYTIEQTPKAITMTKEKKGELGHVKKTVEIILDTEKSEEATHVRIKNAELGESEKAARLMAKELKTPGITSMYIEVKKGECDSNGTYINVAERERVHIRNLLEENVVAVLRRYDDENEKSALWKTYKKLCVSTDSNEPDPLHARYLAKIFEDETGRLQNELITGMFIESGKQTIQGQTQAELAALIETNSVDLKFILSKQAGTQNVFARFFHCASRATSMDRTGAEISLRRQQ